MTIAICDDESTLCKQVETLIKQQGQDYHIQAFASGEELLGAKERFDVIFLDIQMDGINGIETARRLRTDKEEAILIFITGIKEYVFDAFDVSAFHYLLKPIAEEKFREVFARAAAEAGKRKEDREEPFLVKSKGKSVILDRDDILYAESQDKMVSIHTEKETIKIYADMAKLEKQLGRCFYRCHRGYIVNMGYIAEYEKDSISLVNGENLYLSRRKYKEFVKAYMGYLRKGGRLLGSC